MCGCNKNKGQPNARGRKPINAAIVRSNKNFGANNVNVGMNAEQQKKQTLRRDAIRRSKGA